MRLIEDVFIPKIYNPKTLYGMRKMEETWNNVNQLLNIEN